jgi:hypothetical protein
MDGLLWGLGAATVVFAGGISYVVTRRYGWGAAIALPAFALAAMIGMNWQAQDLAFAEGMGLVRETLLFSVPVLVGALVGIALAWRRRA